MFDFTVFAVHSFLFEMDWVPNLGLNFRKSTQNEILGQMKLKPTTDRGVRPINGICFLFGFTSLNYKQHQWPLYAFVSVV